MMLVNYLQDGSGDWSNHRGMEKDRPSSRSKVETSRIAEDKDKMNEDKETD